MEDLAVTLPVVIIGPMAAGKSTVAGALARRLGLSQVPLDAVRWYYHLADRFNFAEQLSEPGFAATVRHWEPYSIAAVERVLAEFPDSVIDFGAGHAHYEDPDRVLRLERALAPLPNVVLLLPSADLERAETICNARDQQRLGPSWDPTRAEVNTGFVRSDCFRRVATQTVYVEERSVEETVDEIVAALVRTRLPAAAPDRAARYREVIDTLDAILDGEDDWVVAMSTVACELHHAFDHYDWTGFYRAVVPTELAIGPYQGGHGCLRIPHDQGVCGAAARTRQTQLVPDVHAFPGHIACSTTTRSEIVVPVLRPDGSLLALLDVDSDQPAAFTDVDRRALEALCASLGRRYA